MLSSVYKRMDIYMYWVATISRLLRMRELFCRIQSLLQGSFVKETYNFIDPTNRSHPICLRDILSSYGVASISRLLRMRELFCRMQSLLQGSFAKETYNSQAMGWLRLGRTNIQQGKNRANESYNRVEGPYIIGWGKATNRLSRFAAQPSQET